MGSLLETCPLFPAEYPQYALEKNESFNHEVFRTKEPSNDVIH